MDKLGRHRVIAGIIRSGSVRRQEELRDRLASQGIETTQGTLSRDLREMGVVKGADGYVLPAVPASADADALRRNLQTLVLSVPPAGAMVVIRTGPGNAGALAVQLDKTPPSGVIGTVAGDDTIFLATPSAQRARELVNQLNDLSGYAVVTP